MIRLEKLTATAFAAALMPMFSFGQSVLPVEGGALQQALSRAGASSLPRVMLPNGARISGAIGPEKAETPFQRIKAMFDSANDSITKENVLGWYTGRGVRESEPSHLTAVLNIGGEFSDDPGCGPACPKTFKLLNMAFYDRGHGPDWFDRLTRPKIDGVFRFISRFAPRVSAPEFKDNQASYQIAVEGGTLYTTVQNFPKWY